MQSILHYDSAGNLVRLLRLADEKARYPTPPAGGGGAIGMDESTNAVVVHNLIGEWDRTHHVVGGALQRDGVAVTIAPDSTAAQDQADFDAQLAAYQAQLQTYLALASPTNAQVAAQVRLLTQGVARLCKIVAQLRNLQGN